MDAGWQRLNQGGLAAALAALVAACGGGPEPQAEPEPAAPRVYFIAPQDGAEVTSPVRFEFGIESYGIAPVPDPLPAEEAVRAGVGHHHLGVNTECLPVGTEIPQADPWIHFGQGNTTIEMQLEPGPHTFVLQLGDDLHRTLEGLCETVSITVVE